MQAYWKLARNILTTALNKTVKQSRQIGFSWVVSETETDAQFRAQSSLTGLKSLA